MSRILYTEGVLGVEGNVVHWLGIYTKIIWDEWSRSICCRLRQKALAVPYSFLFEGYTAGA